MLCTFGAVLYFYDGFSSLYSQWLNDIKKIVQTHWQNTYARNCLLRTLVELECIKEHLCTYSIKSHILCCWLVALQSNFPIFSAIINCKYAILNVFRAVSVQPYLSLETCLSTSKEFVVTACKLLKSEKFIQ